MRYSQVLKAELPLKLCRPAIRTDEHILRQIARVFVIAGKSIAQLVHLPLVPLDNDVERLAAAAAARVDERAIVGGVGQRCGLGPR